MIGKKLKLLLGNFHTISMLGLIPSIMRTMYLASIPLATPMVSLGSRLPFDTELMPDVTPLGRKEFQ